MKHMLESISFYVHQIFSHVYIKFIFSSLFFGAEFVIGGFDLVVRALLILLVLDFVMGFSAAFKDHKLSRRKMMGGLFKMMVYFVGVAMGHWTDIVVFHNDIEFGFKNFIIVYLAVNESLSIIRHMAFFNVRVPMKLVERLENYRDNLTIGGVDPNK